MPRVLRSGPYTSTLPSAYSSAVCRPDALPSINAGPTRLATSMKEWNMLRLMRARVFHADHHAGEQALKHPWRRKVIGRADFLQVDGDRRRRYSGQFTT